MEIDRKKIEKSLKKISKDGTMFFDNIEEVMNVIGVGQNIIRPKTHFDFDNYEEFEEYQKEFCKEHIEELREMIFYLLEIIEDESRYPILFSIAGNMLNAYRIARIIKNIEDEDD